MIFELEAEMSHGSANVLASEYIGTRIDQGKVVMKLLDYSAQVNNGD